MSLEERDAEKKERIRQKMHGTPGPGIPYWPQVLVFIGVLLVAGLWYWWSESGDWVVRVNGAPVSRAKWQQEIGRTEASMAKIGLSVQDQANAQIREQISKEVLQQLVDRALLHQAAVRVGIAVSPEDVEARVMTDMMSTGGQDQLEQALQAQGYTLDEYRQLVAEMIAINELNAYVTKGVSVSEGEIRAAYQSQQEMMTTPEQAKVGHILVATREKALALIAELDKGADFQKLADANSIDPGVKEDHGVVGYITGDDPRLPDAFRDAAFNTRPGTYTKQPVQTEYGWHVLFVYEKKAPRQVSYEDARDQLQQQLLTSKKNEMFTNYLDRLLAGGLIERRVQQLDVPKLF